MSNETDAVIEILRRAQDEILKVRESLAPPFVRELARAVGRIDAAIDMLKTFPVGEK